MNMLEKKVILSIAILSLLSLSAFAQSDPVNDFLWEVTRDPSKFMIIFELSVTPVEEQAMIKFAEHYKITKSNLDNYVDIKTPNLVVIGSPVKNAIIKRLGYFEDPSMTVNDAVGKKLIVTASNPEDIKKMLDDLTARQITAPAGAAKAEGKGEKKEIPVESSSPEEKGIVKKMADMLSPKNNPLAWIIGLLIISPIFAVGVVRKVKQRKEIKERKDRLRSYVMTYMQQGYHPEYLRQYLLQQRWNEGLVNEVFSSLRR